MTELPDLIGSKPTTTDVGDEFSLFKKNCATSLMCVAISAL